MVRVNDLTKRFGPLVAVDHMSFVIEAGESVALWGENGAGKTTALRCLLGVIPFTCQSSISPGKVKTHAASWDLFPKRLVFTMT